MRIRFLGTGNAFNQDGRGSPSTLVELSPESSFLVDIGPTVLRDMACAGVDAATIDRLFLTHLHGDHTAGWPFLALHWVFVAGRRAPVDVYGPRGTRSTLEVLADACYADALRHRRFDVRFHEWDVSETSGVAAGPGLTLDLIPMQHHPSSLGLRFRIETAARVWTVAFSGDTTWCDGLERLARGSDLLVVECSGSEPRADGHLSLAELRAGIERLPAEQIVLIHLTDEVAERLALDPLPRVVAACDGMVLPADTAEATRGD